MGEDGPGGWKIVQKYIKWKSGWKTGIYSNFAKFHVSLVLMEKRGFLNIFVRGSSQEIADPEFVNFVHRSCCIRYAGRAMIAQHTYDTLNLTPKATNIGTISLTFSSLMNGGGSIPIPQKVIRGISSGDGQAL